MVNYIIQETCTIDVNGSAEDINLLKEELRQHRLEPLSSDITNTSYKGVFRAQYHHEIQDILADVWGYST